MFAIVILLYVCANSLRAKTLVFQCMSQVMRKPVSGGLHHLTVTLPNADEPAHMITHLLVTASLVSMCKISSLCKVQSVDRLSHDEALCISLSIM